MKKLLYPLICAFTLLVQTGLWADEAPPSRDQGFWQTFVMIGVLLLCFYVILWRPEQKRRKALEEQRNALKVGDKVSAMGIIGTIDKMNDQTAILKMVDGSRIEVVKGAITEVLPSSPVENP